MREKVYFVAKGWSQGGRQGGRGERLFSLGVVGEPLPRGFYEVEKRGRRITRSTHRGLVMSRLRELEEAEVIRGSSRGK